jgi:2-amino-4-hydroxy-6-hydroxymethyldihydropteridine diphosphokinase
VRVAVALGSNLGNRSETLQWAAARLSETLSDVALSPFHDTAPVGVVGWQPRYLNAVAVGATKLTPRGLLDLLLALERERGRTRPFRNAARVLDLDLILYGDVVLDEPGLTIPHPRFRERAFVLEPLAEIAPDMVDPITGLTSAVLLERIRAQRELRPS